MALRPGSLLKQAQRVLSPRTSTPIRRKSPLNLLSVNKYNSVSPAASARLISSTPPALKTRSKTSRKLLYDDNTDAQEIKYDKTPEIRVNKYGTPEQIETGTPKCKRTKCFDTPLREEILKKQEPFADVPVLGRGSFGTVVQGFYRGEKVAVKIVKAKASHAAAALHNERNALNLKHQNIVDVYKIVYPVPKESGCVIMELVPGGVTLQSFIGFGSRFLSLDEQLSFIVQIASAVHFIHERGIIHLDIKPANILLVENSICKLSDFGSSRRLSDIRDTTFSPHEFLKGTLAYISPEILLGVTPTTKSDVYSLGILMWQLENQLEPYELDDTKHSGPESILYHVIKHKRRPVSKISCRRNKIHPTRLSYQNLYAECWHHCPTSRPCARDVLERISEMQQDH